MPQLIDRPSNFPAEPVSETLHGYRVSDPYRGLEDQDSPPTRSWIEAQTRYARNYLDGIPGRPKIRKRIQELVDVEVYDSFLKCGARCFFRKRRPGDQQPSIYFRERPEGQDQLLIDPAIRRTGIYTAVKPLKASSDGRLLLYEVKEGGERTGVFEIFDVPCRRTLPDALPHGYLRGFAFAPDSKGFYYVHEASTAERPFYRAVYHHVLGNNSRHDQEVFSAGEHEKLRLGIVSGPRQLGLLVQRFFEKTYTDLYLWRMGSIEAPLRVLSEADYHFAPRFLRGRILALTDDGAPNRRIVEVQPRKEQEPLFFTLVPQSDALIRDWLVTANHIFVRYIRGITAEIAVFDSFGKRLGQIPSEEHETTSLLAAAPEEDEILIERQSFTQAPEVHDFSPRTGTANPWARRDLPFDASPYAQIVVSFPSKDGTPIPMFLLGRRDVLAGGPAPVVMTSYGGFGIPVTPKFSVLVAFLVERGCVFALPNIRGGSEFGAHWHHAARRRSRQVAFDDFLFAAQWLIESNRTVPSKLAIFGGSNSGLLVAAAMTQRPDLFRAVLCMVPMLDMLRYHLFDNAHVWKDEFGTAEDPEDFRALHAYSPYHAVRERTAYPATMIVSGDADRNCNPLHARKMTARLQAANSSSNPIFLDYSIHRGHSSVLPLSTRIEALTDRLSFLCDQLGVSV
jgi:prolyl oligopeptidase